MPARPSRRGCFRKSAPGRRGVPGSRSSLPVASKPDHRRPRRAHRGDSRRRKQAQARGGQFFARLQQQTRRALTSSPRKRTIFPGRGALSKNKIREASRSARLTSSCMTTASAPARQDRAGKNAHAGAGFHRYVKPFPAGAAPITRSADRRVRGAGGSQVLAHAPRSRPSAELSAGGRSTGERMGSATKRPKASASATVSTGKGAMAARICSRACSTECIVTRE